MISRSASPSREGPRAWMLPAASVVVLGALALLSQGFHWQDEYAHLQFSRWVWKHPSVGVDLWGRPLATLAYAVPALIGEWAARLLTVGLAAAAAVWTGKVARERGASEKTAWFFALAQPVFFQFSFGALPGVLFAALLARMLLEDARGRMGRAAFFCALLPLARVEGALVVAVYAIALWRRGERRLAVVPFTGVAVWNVAGFAFTGEPLFLLSANPYPVFGSIYPTAGWAYLARILPVGAGVAVCVTGVLGVVAARRAPRLEHAIGAVVAVFLICIWGFPMFASTPTPVYLIGFAPVMALYATDGVAWLGRADRRARLVCAASVVVAAVVLFPRRGPGLQALQTPVSGRERLALGLALAIVAVAMIARRAFALLLLAAAVQLAPWARPVPLSTHERLADQAADFVTQRFPGRALVAVAPDIGWEARADPFIGWEPGSLPADPSTNTSLPANAIVAWDSQFSAHEGATSLASLHASGWKDIREFRAGGVRIVLLSR